MASNKLARAKSRARSNGTYARRYPDWVYHIREDITRANMDLYDRQQEAIRSRCLEINPDYYRLPWLDRMDIFTRARHELGLT